MRFRTLAGAIALAAGLALTLPAPAHAQVLRKLEDAAQNAAESAAEAQIDRLIREAIRCYIGDPMCYDEAMADGEEVVFSNDEGEIIVGDEGVPITDRGEAMATAPPPAPPDKKGWRLDAGGEHIEGRIAYVVRSEGRLALQFINRDAANLAFGRGARCTLVAAEPLFHVRFEASEGPWLTGSYAGMLGCEDFSALPVSGTFRIENPEE